jgi:LytS/YehU family sensor histidine kinase
LRVLAIRKKATKDLIHGKELLELEAKALRAQMNPHFIFNSLNSIKSLIQQNENVKSVSYLTTFSKLIRTLLNNADKKEISLYDEIETCKLYLQLEAMRFDTKFSYAVDIDNDIDLKSIHVPALIIQPFIENAIWHGIVPRNSGGKVSLHVLRKDGIIEVVIDDDGIGRETSQQNKSASGLAHQSKGVNLTQARLELNNLLQQRQAELEVIDKKDEKGMATGTTVIIKIKEELS